jgi:hypothetical protein
MGMTFDRPCGKTAFFDLAGAGFFRTVLCNILKDIDKSLSALLDFGLCSSTHPEDNFGEKLGNSVIHDPYNIIYLSRILSLRRRKEAR